MWEAFCAVEHQLLRCHFSHWENFINHFISLWVPIKRKFALSTLLLLFMFKVSVVLLLEYMRTLTTSVEWKSSIFVKPLHWKIFRGMKFLLIVKWCWMKIMTIKTSSKICFKENVEHLNILFVVLWIRSRIIIFSITKTTQYLSLPGCG